MDIKIYGSSSIIPYLDGSTSYSFNLNHTRDLLDKLVNR